MFEVRLGFPLSYDLEILNEERYHIPANECELKLSESSILYCIQDRSDRSTRVILNKDRARSTNLGTVVGNMTYFGIHHYALVSSSEKNLARFAKIEGLKGIAAYSAYLVKKALFEKKGYSLDMNSEMAKLNRFSKMHDDDGSWLIELGLRTARRLEQESGQSKVLKPMILTLSVSDNFDSTLSEMQYDSYTQWFRKSPLQLGVDYYIQESADLRIMENIWKLEHSIVQRRDFRDGSSQMEELEGLVDPTLDAPEKKALRTILDRVQKSGDGRIGMTERIEETAEYGSVLQDLLISLASKHDRPGLINLEATSERDKLKYAVMR